MTRNLCPNPAAATATGWLAVASAGGVNNSVSVSTTGMLRGTAFRVANGPAAASQGAYAPALAVGPGQSVSATLQIRTSTTVNCTWYLIFYNASGTGIGSATGDTLSAVGGTAYIRTVTGTAPAGTATVRVAVIAANMPGGQVIIATACRYLLGADPDLTYADGDTPGWSWDGTPGASTSTQADAPNTGSSSWWPVLATDLTTPGAPPEFAETFTGKPNRSVHGTPADTGQTWISVASGGANPRTQMDVRGGSMGVPVGHVLGSGYYYSQWDCGAGQAVGHVGCTLVWGNNPSSTDGRACLGAFNIIADQFTSTSGGATMHLTLMPNQVVMAVVTAGINSYTNISPLSGGAPEQTLPVPMAANGVTEYRVDVWLDRVRNLAFCTIQGNPTLVYQHSSVSSVAGRYAFWETGAVSSSGTNVPRFTRVWADRYRAA